MRVSVDSDPSPVARGQLTDGIQLCFRPITALPLDYPFASVDLAYMVAPPAITSLLNTPFYGLVTVTLYIQGDTQV